MQRTPRTAESYFNVNESITLLNIVKSDRIQNAFRSNRKNHASVWKMVASILSRYNDKERSAKQCCNRYENLKKIYTQLKRNPEKHFRRNWPYMYLFREIEEQRGECWGSNSKRIKSEPLYTGVRGTASTMLLTDKLPTTGENLIPPHTYQQIKLNNADLPENSNLNVYDGVGTEGETRKECTENIAYTSGRDPSNYRFNTGMNIDDVDKRSEDTTNFDPLINIKEEYTDQGYVGNGETSFLTHYNGHNDIFQNGQRDIETNILHPDVIVDTDHVTDSSSISLSKRKLSTSSDAESTNYELIEYLKRREQRDERMFKRMEERENRILKLLERTVVAIEQIASHENSFNHQ